MTTSIAIMQPYFVPYLGYFRLFRQTDLFVIYDCVQFPRRGYVHRNQVPDLNGDPLWLTLPLRKCDQKTAIHDLQWREQDCAEFVEKIQRLSSQWPLQIAENIRTDWLKLLGDVECSVVDYLERTLEFVCSQLDLHFNVIRSSSLGIDQELKGQARILEICSKIGATRYVNSPGGRDLYRVEDFARRGIELEVLSPFDGSYWSMAYRLLTEVKPHLIAELSAG